MSGRIREIFRHVTLRADILCSSASLRCWMSRDCRTLHVGVRQETSDLFSLVCPSIFICQASYRGLDPQQSISRVLWHTLRWTKLDLKLGKDKDPIHQLNGITLGFWQGHTGDRQRIVLPWPWPFTIFDLGMVFLAPYNPRFGCCSPLSYPCCWCSSNVNHCPEA